MGNDKKPDEVNDHTANGNKGPQIAHKRCNKSAGSISYPVCKTSLAHQRGNGQDPCGENQNAPRNAAYTFLLVDAAGKEHDNKTCEGYPCVCEPECFCEDPAKNDRDKNDKRNDLLGIKLLGRRYVGFRNGCSCLDNVSGLGLIEDKVGSIAADEGDDQEGKRLKEPIDPGEIVGINRIDKACKSGRAHAPGEETYTQYADGDPTGHKHTCGSLSVWLYPEIFAGRAADHCHDNTLS